MKAKTINTVAASLALGLSASAALGSVVMTTSQYSGPVADTFGTGTLPGYHAWLLSLSSNSGKITAVDFSGPRGITSSLHGIHQDWFQFKGKISTTEQGDKPASATSYDSFFLFPSNSPSNVVVGSALSEDNDKTTSPFVVFNPPSDGDVYGGGTFMHGAWGIVAAAQSTRLDFAYLVISDAALFAPSGIDVRGQVATENGTFDVTLFLIPEPANLTLAGMVLGVSMKIPRRRRSRRC